MVSLFGVKLRKRTEAEFKLVDASLVPQKDLPLQRCLNFEACPCGLALSFLQAVCIAEGHDVTRERVAEEYALMGGDEPEWPPSIAFPSAALPSADLRKALNKLQLGLRFSDFQQGYPGSWRECQKFGEHTLEDCELQVESASYVNAYIDRIEWKPGFETQGDDEIGYTMLTNPDESENSDMGTNKFNEYSYNYSMACDALACCRHVDNGIPFTNWTGSQTLSDSRHRWLIQTRRELTRQAASFLDELISLPGPLLPRPEVILEYMPVIRWLVALDDMRDVPPGSSTVIPRRRWRHVRYLDLSKEALGAAIMDAASNNQTPTLLDRPPSERKLASPLPPPLLFPSLQPLEYLQNNQRRGSITDPSLHASPPDPLDPELSFNSPPRSYSSEHRVKRSPRTIRPTSPFVFGDATIHSSDLVNPSFRGSLRSPSNDTLLDSSRSPDRSDDSSSRTRDKDRGDVKDKARDRDRDRDWHRDRDRDRDRERERDWLPSPRWLDKRSSDAISSNNNTTNSLFQSHSKYNHNNTHRFPSLMADDPDANPNPNRLLPSSLSVNFPMRRHSIAEHPLPQRLVHDPQSHPPSSSNFLGPPGPSHHFSSRSPLSGSSLTAIPSLPHGLKRKISPDRGVGTSLSGTGLYPMGEEPEASYSPHQFGDIQAPAPKRRGSAFDTHRIGIAQLSLYDRRDNVDSRTGNLSSNTHPSAALNSASWWLADRRDSTSSMFSTASLTTNASADASAGGYTSSGFSGDSSFTSQQSQQHMQMPIQASSSSIIRGQSPHPSSSASQEQQQLTPSPGAQGQAVTRQSSLTNLAWGSPNMNMGVNASPNIGAATYLSPGSSTNVNANATNPSAGSGHEAATSASVSSNPPPPTTGGVDPSSSLSSSVSRHLRSHSPTSLVSSGGNLTFLPPPLPSALSSSSSSSESHPHNHPHSQSSLSSFSPTPSTVSPVSATPSTVTGLMPPDRRISVPDAFGHGHGSHPHYYNPHAHSHLTQLSHPHSHPQLPSHQLPPTQTTPHTRTLRSTSRTRSGTSLPLPPPMTGVALTSAGGVARGGVTGRVSDRPASTLSDIERTEEEMTSVSPVHASGPGSSTNLSGHIPSSHPNHHPSSNTGAGGGITGTFSGGSGGGIKEGSSPYSRSPELRVSHKLAERKRRKEMKDLFDELRDQLPADRGMKASKWEILTKAVDYIQTLKVNQQDMARELDLLRRELDLVRSPGTIFHPHSRTSTQINTSTTSAPHYQQASTSHSDTSASNVNIFSHSTLSPSVAGIGTGAGPNASPNPGLGSANATPRESGANSGTGQTG
ncbi:hypothetical protein Clacol_001677 [Clathrus columnatus]|uniref:BHLH domain-containing protein n=1 Tax=Clathrus columnatus TaxID=1419009 RepID=A0AAV5A398_9AGAM|nr:hypothetical protein Clacol_001677 [Clathrus columnatus]